MPRYKLTLKVVLLNILQLIFLFVFPIILIYNKLKLISVEVPQSSTLIQKFIIKIGHKLEQPAPDPIIIPLGVVICCFLGVVATKKVFSEHYRRLPLDSHIRAVINYFTILIILGLFAGLIQKILGWTFLLIFIFITLSFIIKLYANYESKKANN